MKKSIVKVTAAVFLLSQLLSIGGELQDNTASAAAAASTSTKPAAVMTDNLFKYGLKKDIELPATVTADGFSYTLEKIMIYETKSAAAQALIKKYGFTGTENQKYFIWTKITIVNNSTGTVQFNYKDLNEKWRFIFGEEALVSMPGKYAEKVNNTEALWSWSLAPGKKLTSYQGYTYSGQFNKFYVFLKIKNSKSYLDVVEK
ncbi:hypothetical protein [Paenibacillus typhae]|uniref:hypothetical protein n=1 Tax=Paenibacillus typhae TaxID=1174501 RepID=UPI001C8EE1FE|nr:hypothetical protein [Paenibacillus typhae]MBY0013224.1 hypothetical protein [Paenibacillus typhae]